MQFRRWNNEQNRVVVHTYVHKSILIKLTIILYDVCELILFENYNLCAALYIFIILKFTRRAGMSAQYVQVSVKLTTMIVPAQHVKSQI